MTAILKETRSHGGTRIFEIISNNKVQNVAVNFGADESDIDVEDNVKNGMISVSEFKNLFVPESTLYKAMNVTKDSGRNIGTLANMFLNYASEDSFFLQFGNSYGGYVRTKEQALGENQFYVVSGYFFVKPK